LNFGFETKVYFEFERDLKIDKMLGHYRPTPLRWNLVLEIQGAPRTAAGILLSEHLLFPRRFGLGVTTPLYLAEIDGFRLSSFGHGI
jgi:hypothetical protein